MSFERIGQLVKSRTPELSQFSDREVGLAYYNKKLRRPFPSFNRNGGLFTALRIWLLHKQTEWVHTQFNHHILEEELEFRHHHAPLQWQQAEEHRQVQHDLAVTAAKAATELRVDPLTYGQIRLKQEEAKIAQEDYRIKAQIDVDKAKALAEVDVWKKKQENAEHLSFIERVAKLERKNGRAATRVGREAGIRPEAQGPGDDARSKVRPIN